MTNGDTTSPMTLPAGDVVKACLLMGMIVRMPPAGWLEDAQLVAEMQKRITHVVAFREAITLKTMFAKATAKPVVRLQWLADWCKEWQECQHVGMPCPEDYLIFSPMRRAGG